MASHDDDKDFASKGVAGAGLGLGIAGTALGLLRAGGSLDGLGGLFGGGASTRGVKTLVEDEYVLATERRLAAMECEIGRQSVAIVKDQEIDRLRTELAEVKAAKMIDDKTCHMVRGDVYLNPRHMADPYMGTRNIIATSGQVLDTPYGGFRGEFGGIDRLY